MAEKVGDKLLPSIIRRHWVHLASFIWVEAQRERNCGERMNIPNSLKEFQDYMNWTEDDCELDTLKRNYYVTRNTFLKDREKLKER